MAAASAAEGGEPRMNLDQPRVLRALVPTSGAEAPRPLLSVVIPVFNEVENLRDLVDQVEAALTPLRERGREYEVLLVDDGSSDGTRPLLTELASSRPWLLPL